RSAAKPRCTPRSRCHCCRIRAARRTASARGTDVGFRFRLASFLIATLVVVQVVTAVLVYGVTRRELVAEGGRQLELSADAFGRQLDGVAERLAASVAVLA